MVPFRVNVHALAFPACFDNRGACPIFPFRFLKLLMIPHVHYMSLCLAEGIQVSNEGATHQLQIEALTGLACSSTGPVGTQASKIWLNYLIRHFLPHLGSVTRFHPRQVLPCMHMTAAQPAGPREPFAVQKRSLMVQT